ncbi:hypothetical protein [Rubrobacter aplysinae]|uniref:hypothetical protein n=1 Tax=Rubrobacter aplysinae TaxID=909625 RepID=UPI00064BD831|nr:hypothetical protein [Rubrobacter aplysinae]
MSRRRMSGAGATSSRAKVAVWVALALVVVGVWIAVVVALGGGGEDDSTDGGQPSGAETTEGKSGDRASEDSEAGGSGTGEDEDAGTGSGDGPVQGQNASNDGLSKPVGGGVPEGEVAIEDEEGRSNGQRGFVSSFVGAAYGYTGKDVEEYRSGYEGRINPDTYYDSPGAETLSYYVSLVEDGGAENAAVLEEYTILSGEPVGQKIAPGQLTGFVPAQLMQAETPPAASVSEVTYAVGNRYGDPAEDEGFGKVYGDVKYLEQRLLLAKRGEGSGWIILAASAPESTEPPERPDPDAPKVGEPGGPGGHEH